MAKILVIDDDQAIVDLLRLRLAEAGHELFSAMDASGGVMMAARVRPDLITLDYQMPAGDGGTTHQRLRTNTFTSGVPIVFITGMNPDDLSPGLRADPKARFIQKPIDMDKLKALIAELLGPAPPAAPAAKPAPPPAPPSASAADGDILDLDL